MNPILEIKDLTKKYGNKENIVYALDHIEFKVDKPSFIVVLGSSGSGKSTLLNMIGGIDLPTSGDVIFEGNCITQMKDKNRTEYRRNHIGFIFQNFNLIPDLTILENVELTESFGGSFSAEEMLLRVGLSDKLNNYPSELSGGQQQRAAIARALVKNSDIILCDEPTGALDSNTGIMILKLIKEISCEYKKTVILVTHTKEIAYLADRVIQMKNGKIVNDYWNEHPKNPEEIEW